MPLAYALDPSHDLVITLAAGIVTLGEIVDHQNQLLADLEFSPNYDQLLDCRMVDVISLSVREARLVSRRRMFSRNSRRAFLTSKETVFGMARMLQAFNETSSAPNNSQIFYELDAALRWLNREELAAAFAA
jgi:hypothetical protein